MKVGQYKVGQYKVGQYKVGQYIVQKKHFTINKVLYKNSSS